MTATMSANGRPQRKQLGDQLDRLDLILNGLAEAIPGAVADAIRDTLADAVGKAVREALASGKFPAPAARSAEPETSPGGASRLKVWWFRVRAFLVRAIGRGKEWVGRRYQTGRRWFSRAAMAWAVVRLVTSQVTRSHRSSTLPVLAGVSGGVAGYLLGPVIESVVLGLLVSGLAFAAGLVTPWVRLLKWDVAGR